MPETPLLNNRYQLEGSIGSGGMAVVYRARDLMLERTVAVKVLREDYSADPAFRERFRQEARAAANLSHPNIVTIHDFGLDAGRLFIVMEMVPGTDLKTIMQKRGRFSQEDAINLMAQACAGIGYAHRAGLIHCDVKPHNMLVTPDRRLKVTDFGIARALASIRPDEKAHVVWGSPQYFSPEQAAGEAPLPASDVYSLGVVMFEMLTGQLPFIADNATELARLHRETPPPSPRQINPATSAPLEQILMKVLSKEPSSRYRTADQLGRVLMTYNQTGQVPPGSGPVRVSRPADERPRPSQPVGVYRHASNNPSARSQSAPLQRPVIPSGPPKIEIPPAPEENPLDIDWSTIGLGLLALLAVGGLIPFWLWIYFIYNPPIR